MPDDSCDEFPFAQSKEGGNIGALCVDILPQEVGVCGVSRMSRPCGAPRTRPVCAPTSPTT
ncbi:NucA/NucB deoxyribonuclease domain-containing protein [Streptomyces rectiverticillatus]|uniref:NucA/NucB deoxyribonuclease domain-containing protein n=1 Tax=Streptomyces rectiverticillatus TaxID=173860 RepID=UPI003CCC9170